MAHSLPNLMSNGMNKEVMAITGLLESQWTLFIQAWENKNIDLMRTMLVQAVSSQLRLEQLVGYSEMMRLQDNWLAKEELEKLEASQPASHPMNLDPLSVVNEPKQMNHPSSYQIPANLQLKPAEAGTNTQNESSLPPPQPLAQPHTMEGHPFTSLPPASS
ncbi:hypothetical protein PCASD_24254 [Puccinia coronata f. sp. avenae]|uniref:Uncharacterized protein n=1 Tax=Puccinia coronata f. sp. avenae TaxID=200324 RepID=A0A2N5TXA6_9BASI|nr:hypothetical protein PCASD_24254 [Puccinia coronata f. sp. avenae]